MEPPTPVEDREELRDSEGPDDLPGPDVIIIFAAFFEGGLAFLSLLLGWWLGHNPLERFSWRLEDALCGLAAMLPLVGLFVLILHRPVGPLRQIRSFCEEEFVPLLSGSSWSDMLLVSISAGVGEELLFRGVIQGTLAAWMGDAGGIAVSSVVFGILHPISMPYVVLTMVLGAYLGTLYLLTGNLLAPMITHATYDLALMAYLLRWRYRGRQGESIPPVDPHEDIDH
ncbi:CPBP family intramembrane glutamic endopeptidase [Aquisphaera giovannonii]|uniref:CPBP family intramembrane glutamic endopeptidase n=1 Tax=Aquisphaera giovannonii TaxID=406548 RepID=UPI00143D3514|nr:CPBP family intramembrane glutamic endopeptidase [Aquisphaera giovannonii]